jgi:hypothetical protein
MEGRKWGESVKKKCVLTSLEKSSGCVTEGKEEVLDPGE